MAVTLRFTVEDVETRLLIYTHINVYRSDTLTGVYASIGMVALVSGTYQYSYSDSTGNLNKWYKYTFWIAGPTESDPSDPFRVDGVSRLRIRQGALAKYGAGLIFAAAAGGDTNTILTTDYRVKAAQFKANRGKGTWLQITTGTYAGERRLIASSDPSAGSFDIEVVLAGALSAGDQVEWHWLAELEVWDEAINRGLSRYFYTDRVPVPGVSGQEEYLLDSLPWITDREQIHDVVYYPVSGEDIPMSYGTAGRWWGTRKDGSGLWLVLSPATTSTLYLECTRPMPPLFTDAAALPSGASEPLCIALAYDEVLSYLSRPSSGASEDRRGWKNERKAHAAELHHLLVDNRPKPRRAPPQTPYPPVSTERFTSR